MKVFAIIVLMLCGANADKVIGGESASTGQFKSIVFQKKSGSFFCGGTIIGSTTVLSAAHCEQKNINGLTVTGGTTQITGVGGTEIPVSSKLVNPDYNSRTLQNDIMLLYLEASIDSSANIVAAQLVNTAPTDGEKMTVAGWGNTNTAVTNYPRTLQYNSDVAVIATSTCNDGSAYDGEILDGMICIGVMAGGDDTCQGDSGGPAYVGDGSSNTIAGITSWGYGCAEPNNPGVYTDVAFFYEWINLKM